MYSLRAKRDGLLLLDLAINPAISSYHQRKHDRYKAITWETKSK